MNTNGQPWTDDAGDLIQAHGGMILHHGNTYYWYGENKGVDNYRNAEGVNMVPFIGISCYTSPDLLTWHHAGIVLNEASDPTNTLTKESICERPKVLYDAERDRFVMWCHYDTPDYKYAGNLVAIADNPTGPFQVQKVLRPNGKESRDMTVYQDGEHTYLIHSSDMNKTLYFSEMTPDLTDFTGFNAKAFVDQEREAPTVFHDGDWYYTITSGCTGWKPNPALFSRSHFLFSNQKLIDNPCVGPRARTTYDGQPTYVLTVNGQYYLMLDHWQRFDLKHSGYSILPIEIHGRDLEIPWNDTPFGGPIQ
ncbi:glycoside hydrolase family 43 protein [Schleiferilactobacillus harbinensis]|uniref:glycoside hydrolase family 43 protein n=1 Tax=Schleiferilactobacillus harbinensis TaxID=304207 RepID=UPI0039EBD49B